MGHSNHERLHLPCPASGVKAAIHQVVAQMDVAVSEEGGEIVVDGWIGHNECIDEDLLRVLQAEAVPFNYELYSECVDTEGLRYGYWRPGMELVADYAAEGVDYVPAALLEKLIADHPDEPGGAVLAEVSRRQALVPDLPDQVNG